MSTTFYYHADRIVGSATGRDVLIRDMSVLTKRSNSKVTSQPGSLNNLNIQTVRDLRFAYCKYMTLRNKVKRLTGELPPNRKYESLPTMEHKDSIFEIMGKDDDDDDEGTFLDEMRSNQYLLDGTF